MFRKVRRIVSESVEAVYNACFNRPIGYIYMFHKVCPKEDYLASIDELRVSPEYFEQFLLEQQKHVDFISIDEVPSRLIDAQLRKRPFCVITFDDGYADNFTYAYPVLKKLGIPFVIYVSVGLVNDHTPIWNYPLILERIVRMHGELDIDGQRYYCNTQEQKNETFVRLKALLLSLPYQHLRDEFCRLFADYLNPSVFAADTLTWEQIEQLAADSLCTIGSHTMTHCRLTMTDAAALEYELGHSKFVLEQHIGRPVVHLSYPYGWKNDVSPAAKAYARQAGYQTAMISWGGTVRHRDKDIYALKRIMIHE